MCDPKELGCYLETRGWAVYRGKVGGTNNLRWNKWTGRVICAKCGADRVMGVKGQESLF